MSGPSVGRRSVVRRGQVWIVDLDPVVGSEQGGRRPAVVASNDLINATSWAVLVVPFTTYREGTRVYPSQFIVDPSTNNGLRYRSVVMGEQVRVVDRLRFLSGPLGLFSDTAMAALDRRLCVALALPPPKR